MSVSSTRLRLGIDPVEVFDDEQQGLRLALPSSRRLTASRVRCRRWGALSACHCEFFDRYIEEHEERWRGGLEGVIEAAECSGHLLLDRRQIIAVFDAEVGPEEIDDRKIGGGLADSRSPASRGSAMEARGRHG